MGAYRRPAPRMPACPMCGTRDKVVLMANSLTPFDQPNIENPEADKRYYCQVCSHDFEPEPEEE